MDTKFEDKNGGEWVVDLNYGILETIKKEIGVDLFSILDDEKKEKLAEQLSDNSITFQVIYVICEQQASKRGISPEEFGGLFKLSHVRKAWKAVRAGLLDFFLGTPEGRILTILFQAEDEVEAGMQQMLDEAIPEATLKANKLKEELKAQIQDAIDEKLHSTSGNLDGDLEASLDGTTASTP